MGAESFETLASGKNPEDAFRSAVDHALWEYGHGGYSGTIAEKSSFRRIRTMMPFDEAMGLVVQYEQASYLGQEWVQKNGSPEELEQWRGLSDEVKQGQNPFRDKWGPAGYIEIDPETVTPREYVIGSGDRMYLFFGIASS